MQLEVLLNAKAGTLAREHEEDGRRRVHDAFAQRGVEARVRCIDCERFAEQVREAAAGPADVIVIGGGDGTLNTAASVLAHTGRTMAVLPLGTFNHFAKDLDIPLDLEGAVEAIVAGVAAPLDIAEVNGRIFINHSAIGLYARILRRRERQRHEQGRNKWSAMALAMLAEFYDYGTLGLTIRLGSAAVRRRTPFVFIGNNRYILESYGLKHEEVEPRSKLWIYIAKDAGRLGMIKAGIDAFLGRGEARDAFDALVLDHAVIEARRPSLLVELDGEIARLQTPLAYRLLPGALNVVQPPARAVEMETARAAAAGDKPRQALG